MKNNILYVISFFCLSSVLNISAQHFQTSRLSYIDGYLISPARTLSSDGVTGLVSYRQMYAGLEGAPINIKAGFYGKVNPKMGMGVMLTNNRQGLFDNTKIDISYAYQLQLAKDHFLSMGLTGGLLFRTLDQSNIINQDVYDPSLHTDNVDYMNFHGGFALAYTWNRVNVDLVMPISKQNDEVYKHFLSSATFSFDLNTDFKISPSVMLEFIPVNYNIFEGSVTALYRNKIWLRSAYRSNSTGQIAIGMNLGRFKYGYAHEINTGEFSSVGKSNHEMVVAFTFGGKKAQKLDNIEQMLTQNKADIKVLKSDQDSTNSKILEAVAILNKLEGQATDIDEKLENQTKNIDEKLERIEELIDISTDDVEGINLDKKSISIDRGSYIVIHTFNDLKSAQVSIDVLKERSLSAKILHNKSRELYYIYTDYKKKKEDAIPVMKAHRKKGFKKAWVYVY